MIRVLETTSRKKIIRTVRSQIVSGGVSVPNPVNRRFFKISGDTGWKLLSRQSAFLAYLSFMANH